ncbi:hypothetical protein B0H14DRAFT_2722619 [Mycena olivaceomarginata]|nr:hypothetical protein B0H14DRAFT_2722619 [Mycena olivaceomarginata]
MIYRNSLLIIPECSRMFGLGRQTRCWLGLHPNRIGSANGGVLLYRKNGCSGGGRKDLTEPAAHIRRQTGIPPEASPNAHRCDHRGGGVLPHHRRREGFWRRKGRREGREPAHRGWKESDGLSVRCDDEYECLCPQVILMLLPNASQTASRSVMLGLRSTHDAGRKIHSDKSWFLPMMTFDTVECNWREREDRDHKAMEEDGRERESET